MTPARDLSEDGQSRLCSLALYALLMVAIRSTASLLCPIPMRPRHATATLARLEKSADLGHLGVDRTGEPIAGHQIVQPSKGTVADIELLDVVDTCAALDGINLEPGVESSRHSMFQRDVDTVRAAPIGIG